jgi:transcriptional regulator with XRE-family HTH domain
MPKPRSIGEWLKARRLRKGLTLQATAKAARIDPSALSRLERDLHDDIRVRTLARLAAALEFSLDEFAAETRLLPDLPRRRIAPAGLDASHLDGLRGLVRDLDAEIGRIDRLARG